MKKIAIFGTSCNPIHNGHIQTIQFVLNASNDFDEIWVTPCFKSIQNKSLVLSKHRLKMCELAIENKIKIKIFDYEIRHRLDGKIIELIKLLKNDLEYKKYNFSMIIGQDNANTFDSWVNYEELERMMRFVIIPRKGFERIDNVSWYLKPPHIFLNKEKTGIIEASSTELRKLMKSYWKTPTEKKKTKLLEKLDPKVFNYIQKNGLYK